MPGPGLLVAATGIGAGALATASFTGSILGTAVLWAAVVGAFLNHVVTEGLARRQLAAVDTLLEGLVRRIGRLVAWFFLPYLVIWSFFVASALMSACGVTLHAKIPLFDDAAHGKVVFGALASLVGLGLVLAGGYELFEKIMSVCIGIMFVNVIVTAARRCWCSSPNGWSSRWGRPASGSSSRRRGRGAQQPARRVAGCAVPVCRYAGPAARGPGHGRRRIDTGSLAYRG